MPSSKLMKMHPTVHILLIAVTFCLASSNKEAFSQGLQMSGSIKSTSGEVFSLLFSNDSQTLYLGVYERVLVVNPDENEVEQTWKGFSGSITGLDITSDDQLLACGTYQKVTLHSPKDGSLLQTLKHHRGQVTSIRFLDSSQLVSAADDGTLALWKKNPEQDSWELAGEWENEEPILAMDVSKQDNVAVVGIGDETRATRPGSVVVIDLSNFETLKTHEIHRLVTSAIRITPKSEILSGSFDETIIVTRIKEGDQTGIFKQHGRPINAITLIPNSTWIASGSGGRHKEKNELILWDLKTGEVFSRIEQHKGKVLSVAVSPDKKWLVSGGNDKIALIYSFEDFFKQKSASE